MQIVFVDRITWRALGIIGFPTKNNVNFEFPDCRIHKNLNF